MEALITATAASLFVTVSAILNNNLIHPRKQKENGENLQFVIDFNTFRMEDLKLRFEAQICYYLLLILLLCGRADINPNYIVHV